MLSSVAVWLEPNELNLILDWIFDDAIICSNFIDIVKLFKELLKEKFFKSNFRLKIITK